MARSKIKFAWKPTISGREQWRWGLWMRIPSRSRSGGHGIKLMVRGLLIWGVCLMLSAYVALTTVWFYVLNQRPSNLVTWADCVLVPVRWTEIRSKRGDAYINEGIAAMQARKWSEAIHKIEAGLAISPNNRHGRRQLGVFFIVAGQRERGLKLLEEGVTNYFPGRDEVQLIVRLAVEGEDFSTALRVIDKSLRHTGRAVEREETWLRDQTTHLLMLSQRYEAALDWIEQQETRTEVMRESKVIAYIELGKFEPARSALEDWQASGGSAAAVQRIRVRLAREAGSVKEMRDGLAAMRQSNPQDPQPWIYAVVQEFMVGETQAAHAALGDFLLRFGGQKAPLLLAAPPLVQIKAWDLFSAIETRFTELGFSDRPFTTLRIEAAIARADLVQARTLLEAFPRDVGADLTGDDRLWRESASALVEYLTAREESFGADLLNQIKGSAYSLSRLKWYAETLQEKNAPEFALRVLAIARQRFPGSHDVAQHHQTLAAKMDQPAQLDGEVPLVQDGTPLDLDREIEALTRDDVTPLAVRSAKQFLEQSARMMEGEQWNELSDLLRELRRARPEWAETYRQEITTREIALGIANKNWPALVTHVRLLLDGSVPRALLVMGIVREVDVQGEREAADTLLAEVERRHPDFPPARRLREDWAVTAVPAPSEAPE